MKSYHKRHTPADAAIVFIDQQPPMLSEVCSTWPTIEMLGPGSFSLDAKLNRLAR